MRITTRDESIEGSEWRSVAIKFDGGGFIHAEVELMVKEVDELIFMLTNWRQEALYTETGEDNETDISEGDTTTD